MRGLCLGVLLGTFAMAAPPVMERRIPGPLRGAVRVAGDRLIRAGSERAIVQGQVRLGTAAPMAAAVVIEPGGRISMGLAGKNIGSDGSNYWSGSGSLAGAEADLLETVVSDSLDNLVISAAGNAPFRFYGSRFRDAAGTYYDIYEVSDTRQRIFCVNSNTGLLERVRYQVARGPSAVAVETVLSGWKAFGGQMYPGKIVRYEGGVAALEFDIDIVTFREAAADGVFSPGH